MTECEPVILIVDDEPSSRWALAHVLRRLRARCLEAADGRGLVGPACTLAEILAVDAEARRLAQSVLDRYV